MNGAQVDVKRYKSSRIKEQFSTAHEQRLADDWSKKSYPDYKNKYDKTVKKRMWTEVDQLFEDELWNS